MEGHSPCARHGESEQASRDGAPFRIRTPPVIRGQAGACPSISRREKRTRLEERMPKASGWRGTVPCARHGESGRASKGGAPFRIRTPPFHRRQAGACPSISRREKMTRLAEWMPQGIWMEGHSPLCPPRRIRARFQERLVFPNSDTAFPSRASGSLPLHFHAVKKGRGWKNGCRMASGWRGTVPCARIGESGRASGSGSSFRIRTPSFLRGQAGACPSISRREKRTRLEEWMPNGIWMEGHSPLCPPRRIRARFPGRRVFPSSDTAFPSRASRSLPLHFTP